MRTIKFKLFFFSLFLIAQTMRAELPVHYVLAPQMVIADLTPHAMLPAQAELMRDFSAQFHAAYPGQIFGLNDPEQRISPDDRVLLVIPTITAARLSEDVTAGSIHDFDAVVVGDVSILDPWTNSNLYSGTLLADASFRIGDSAMATRDSHARDAFAAASHLWLQRCIEKLHAQARPFVLDAKTLALPSKLNHGGIWPYGSERGVTQGAILRGAQGHLAKVMAVFPQYSLIADVVDATRKIPASELYSLTLVTDATNRKEPTVELQWIGREPFASESFPVQTLSSAALIRLFNNYLSQQGGLRILPYTPDHFAMDQVEQFNQQVERIAKAKVVSLTTQLRNSFVQTAAQAPDRMVELGILACYHGARALPGGGTENLYRLTLAATMRERAATTEHPLYPFFAVLERKEELSRVEKPGVRQLDPNSIYLTLYRNAIVRLAEQVRRQSALLQPADQSLQQASVSNAGVDWKGAPPEASTVVSWMRPEGELHDESGKNLGRLYRSMTPARGLLTVAQLGQQKLEQGDLVQYHSGPHVQAPILALSVEMPKDAPEWWPASPWILRLAAQQLGEAAHAQFLPQEGSDAPETGLAATLNLTAMAEHTDATSASFTAQLRMRLQRQPADPGDPPLLKFGIQSDFPVTWPGNRQPLQPLDLSDWGHDFLTSALQALRATGTRKGVEQAIHSNF
jgi:hypothetical protein